ncbi:MAG: AmmeMemoRadiSam system protein B [Spirochaetales bacterium]|nr:AmmeMemoRadiSam system protein B [Spirochaetales bacterium]
MPADYPKLRPVEAFAMEDNLIGLRDLEGFTKKIVMLKPEIFFICTLFDGRHSIVDIQEAFSKQFGVMVTGEIVRQIIDKLDEYFFLETERFIEERKKEIAAFRGNTVRSAVHAGSAYEGDPSKLRLQLEEFFNRTDSPGIPDTSKPTGRLIGLMAPHIDIERGGLCFAQSYAELARECNAETFLILGIAHMPTEKTFVVTEKDFETPFGILPSEKRFISILRGKCRRDFSSDEFVHKNEHSIEFQVLFLQYLFQKKNGISIIPVLCSSMHESIMNNTSPYRKAEIKEFIDALGETIDMFDGDVCVIAGVDLSHIGQRFNQDITITDTVAGELKESDRKLLEPVLDGDAEMFIQRIAEQTDRTNICGIPAIYTLLKLLNPKKSKLLLYDQSIDYGANSIVSFAGAGFYR